MSFQPGSIPYLRNLLRGRLRQDYGRAKVIRDLAALNFDTWPDMSAAEKDATMRQSLRAVSELAGMVMRHIRLELDELRDDD